MDLKKISAGDKGFYYGLSGDQTTILNKRIVLDEKVDAEILRAALAEALERYPKMKDRAVVHEGSLYYAPNDSEPVIFEDDRRRLIGTDETAGYLFAIDVSGTEIHIRMHHGLMDGNGYFQFLKTLLYYYFTKKGYYIDTEGMVLTNDDPPEDPQDHYAYEKYGRDDAQPLVLYESSKAFRVPDELYDVSRPICRKFRITSRMDTLLKIAKRHETSVVPVFAAMLSQTLHDIYDVGDEPVTGYIPVNLRPVFKAKAPGNFSLNITLPFAAGLAQKNFDTQVTVERGILDLQKQKENFEYRLYRLCANSEKLDMIDPDPAVRQQLIGQKMKATSREKFTYLMSYVGHEGLPADMEIHVVSMEHTQPAFTVPLVMRGAEYKGRLSMVITQAFESDSIPKELCSMMNEYGGEAEYADLGTEEFDKFLIGKMEVV